MDYIHLKTSFEPTLGSRRLSDVIRHEVKGTNLRRDIRNAGSRNSRRRAIKYLDSALGLLEQYRCQIMGQVLIKKPGETYGHATTYPKAVSELATTFNNQAAALDQRAWMVLDARTKSKNEGNVHTITTRRYRSGGSLYPQLVESPVFGHSDTHVLLQLADLVASAFVYSCASHLDPALQIVRSMFGQRLNKLQYLYSDDAGDLRGGFRVIDRMNRNPSRMLF